MTTPTQYDFVAGEWVVVADPHAPEPPPWHEDEQPVTPELIAEQDLEYEMLMDWHHEQMERAEYGIEDDAEFHRRGGAGSPF